jgi:hypothetical protein
VDLVMPASPLPGEAAAIGVSAEIARRQGAVGNPARRWPAVGILHHRPGWMSGDRLGRLRSTSRRWLGALNRSLVQGMLGGFFGMRR